MENNTNHDKIIFERERNHELSIRNFNIDRNYWPNPKYGTYKFGSTSWNIHMKKIGIGTDEDILGMEYTDSQQGMHHNFNLDLLLRMELSKERATKLTKLFETRAMSLSEMVEELIAKLLDSSQNLEEIIKQKKPFRGRAFFGYDYEHITDISTIDPSINKL